MPPPACRKSLYPDSSIPYTNYIKPEKLVDAFAKLDKKIPPELHPRPTFLKVGVLTQVKGSAYLEYGDTKVMAAVLPPREITKQMKKSPLGIIDVQLKYAPFASRDQPQNITKKVEFLNVALKKSLEPVICLNEFTNFQLEITVHILQDDGCVLSSAINCCGAALAEGGIPIYDIISASTICLCKNQLFVNPTSKEEQFADGLDDDSEYEHGIVVIASLSAVNQLAGCFQKGLMEYDTVAKLTEQALIINQSILKTIKHVLVNKVKSHIK